MRRPEALDLFRGCFFTEDRPLAVALAERGRVRRYKAGEGLISQGATDRGVYFLVRGEVDIRVHGRLVGVRRAGQHVGEMAAINRRAHRSADVIAREPVVALVVPAEAVHELADQHPALWRSFAIELADRLERRGVRVEPAPPGARLLGPRLWAAVRPALQVNDEAGERMLHGDPAVLRGALLAARERSPELRAELARAVQELDVVSAPAQHERIIVRNDLLPARFAEGLSGAIRAVARVEVEGVGRGTGWLITPDLLVTALHVLRRGDGEDVRAVTEAVAIHRRVRVVFGDDGDGRGKVIEALAVVAGSTPLDYAFVRLERRVDVAPLPIRPCPLKLPSEPPMAVNIVQHPWGGSKKLGIRNNHLAEVRDERLTYYTDTEEGSSGAPVLDDDWHVVGLHVRFDHARPATVYQGERVAWVNEGVRIDRMLADLQDRFPEVWAELRP